MLQHYRSPPQGNRCSRMVRTDSALLQVSALPGNPNTVLKNLFIKVSGAADNCRYLAATRAPGLEQARWS